MSTIITWLTQLVSTFVAGLLGKLGSWLLNVAVVFLEAKFPGLTPVINQILTWLGQGVPPSQIASHLAKASFTIKP